MQAAKLNSSWGEIMLDQDLKLTEADEMRFNWISPGLIESPGVNRIKPDRFDAVQASKLVTAKSRFRRNKNCSQIKKQALEGIQETSPRSAFDHSS